MRIHQLSVDDALSGVRSTRDGLSAAEALRRLREYGPNRIEKIAGESWALRLPKELFRFFSVILWVAAALAFFAEWQDPGQGMARLGAAIVAVIVVSGAFSLWQEYRGERTLAALQKLLPQSVQTRRDGAVVQLPVEQLVPGDVVHLAAGDNVPADCRLIEAFDMRVNIATVTGESLPRARNTQPSPAEDLIRSANILLAGTSVVSGRGQGLVFATGALTEFGRIARLTQTAGEGESPLRTELARLSRLIAVLAVAIGAAFFAIGSAIGVPFWQDLVFTIGIIVAMVPEGLLPTLTLALVLAAQRMAKRNVLIRHLPSVETLGSATVICTDKTGTLTENRMRVREAVLGQDSHPVSDLEGNAALVARHADFFMAARLCHDLRETQQDGGRVLLGDPMEIALVEMAGRALPGPAAPRRLDEVPFDAERMRQSVVHQTAAGPVLYCKGAPESVLPLCGRFVDGGEVRPIDPATMDLIVRKHEAMAEKGLRVLALASRALPAQWAHDGLERDLVLQGLVGLEDPPRPEVPDAMRKCREAGIAVIMVTGDHPRTATAIAREIGMVTSPDPLVVSGDRLARLSPVELQLALDAPEIVFARVSADQKLRIVEALMHKGRVVAVTGDGVNDAPALKAAHIGIAMGIMGTDVAKAAADMVLLDDNFASIVDAIEEGRGIFDNIRKFLTYVLVHNVAELVPYLAFALFGIPLPLTPIQALSVDMGSDSLTALGLGVERPGSHVMKIPPRSRAERLLNLPLALRAYLFLGVIEAAAAMSAYFFVLHAGGWSWGQGLAADDPLYRQATTACLGAIVVLQVVNVFLCRSPVRSAFATGFADNPLILWGVALEIVVIVLIAYTPFGNDILGTAPVPPDVWLFILPFAAGMLAIEELRKWIVRRSARDGRRPG